MATTRSKTTGRAAKVRKATPARRAPGRVTPVSLDEASPARQQKFFLAVRRLMREQGLRGNLVGVSLEPPATRGLVAEAIGCPPGHVRRVVCVKRPNGTIACHSECQPF